MRRTTRSHKHTLVMILTVDQEANDYVILSRRDVGEFFTAAGTDHEKDIEHLGTKLVRPIDHLRQFLVIHGLRTEVHLEWQAVSLAGFDASECGFPGTGDATEAIVFLGIKRIDTNPHPHPADFTQLLRQPVIDQHAVGSEHYHEPEFHGMQSN